MGVDLVNPFTSPDATTNRAGEPEGEP